MREKTSLLQLEPWSLSVPYPSILQSVLHPGPQSVHIVETQQLGAGAEDNTACPLSSVPVFRSHQGGRLAVQPTETGNPVEVEGAR